MLIATYVQEAADLVSDLFDPMQVPAFKTTNEITSKQNQQQAKDRALHLTDLDQRLRDMDRQGIDIQLLIQFIQTYYAIRNDKS